jgi:hypothetical protein
VLSRVGANDATPREHNIIQVFSADGSQLIGGFGDFGGLKTVEESPEKIHNTQRGGIAVDDSGNVYVSDLVNGVPRVMVFKPQAPGDYEHYVYSGRANDIATPFSGSMALDNANNLYMATGFGIAKFDLADPAAPTCEYEVADQGLFAMTVNPANGDVFYWDYKYKTAKFIHQLSACNAQGEFEGKGIITLTPKPVEIRAMAFNPAYAWSASRPPATLYAADASAESEGHPAGRGYIFASAEVHPPVVESESVSAVTASTASLNAQINPKGSTTHYAFQYIAQAAYEANPPGERFAAAAESPLGGSELGASQEGLSAAASLVGLEPDTEYRYRVLATSHCEPDDEEALCEDTGEDQAFRTFPAEAPGLPDNRAWELVSPTQKYGGEVFPLEPDTGSSPRCGLSLGGCKPGTAGKHFPKQSSSDGEAVAYEGFAFSATEGAAKLNEYVSRRTSTGWQTTILAPARLSDSEGSYDGFDKELTQSVLFQGGPPSLTPDAPSEYKNLYAQPTASPSALGPLVGLEPPDRSPAAFLPDYAGASDDFSHLFFAANDALTGETVFAPEAVDGGAEINTQANLYESVGGQLRLVNVLPGNAETEPGAHFGSGFGSDLPHATSADGSRVYWSDKAGQLYVRVNGETTVEIPDLGKYLTASEDGSRLLLNDGHIYDLRTEETTDLTQGQGGFEGIAGQSEDLSHIYFADSAVLTGEEENDRGAKAQANQDNLYAWHEGEVAFVATLVNSKHDWDSSPRERSAQASPSGRWLAFASTAPLTGYDNVGPTCGFDSTFHYFATSCNEAFLYDSETGTLHCASCNPSGVRPLGRTTLPLQSGGSEEYLPQTRFLTDSGRLYFDSQDSLSPFDTNRGVEAPGSDGKPSGSGKLSAEDVYQYEPEGIGSCKRAGGCINLISGGHEAADSNFLATDETGKNVFFTTRDQLTLKDGDDLIDLYDAREGGGLAAETEATNPACQGEACQPAIVPPDDPTPATSSRHGAGNVQDESPRACPKGKTRKHGRCVKKPPQSKKHHKRHHNHRGAK